MPESESPSKPESAAAEPESPGPGPIPLLGWRAELRIAAAFLTAVPIPLSDADARQPVGVAVRAFPLVGVVVGGAGGAVYALVDFIGLAASLAAFLSVATMIGLTGALHEDGLADTADGLGGRDRVQRLAIMRDSRIGAYGVLALVLAVGLRVDALSYVGWSGEAFRILIAAAAGSRACIPAVMYLLDPARPDGLGHDAGRPDHRRVVDAGAIGATVIVLVIGPIAAAAAIAAAVLAVSALAWLARRRFGGFTGDTLGAVQQVSEIVILLAFLAVPA